MKNVVFLVNSLDGGGAERITLNLYNHFKKDRDINPYLVLLEKKVFYEVEGDKNVIYLSDLDGRENPIKKLISMITLGVRLKKLVKEKDIDLVQSHLYRSNYINILGKLFGGRHKTQLVNHDNYFISNYKTTLGKCKNMLIKFFYKKGDKVIGISKDMTDALSTLTKREVIKINNPYDIEKIVTLSKEEVVDLQGDRKFMILVGSLLPVKGMDIAFKSFATIKDKYKDYDLLVLGDSTNEEYKRYIKNVPRELGIKDRVHFLGRVDNPFKYLRRSDIFILSSLSEGFPNALIEALATRCKVVASDCVSGPREIIGPSIKDRVESLVEGEYGYLYPVGDIKALAGGMEKAIKVEVDGEKLYKRAIEFSYENIMTLYKEVLVDD